MASGEVGVATLAVASVFQSWCWRLVVLAVGLTLTLFVIRLKRLPGRAALDRTEWEVNVHAEGSLVRIIRDRGFGFVRTQDGSEVFVHHSTLPRGVFDTLQEGQEIEFDIENDLRGRGQRAANVRLIDR